MHVLFASKGYFPISMVKTQDLPADRKYVFGYHPHGIIGMGAIANFGTEGMQSRLRCYSHRLNQHEDSNWVFGTLSWTQAASLDGKRSRLLTSQSKLIWLRIAHHQLPLTILSRYIVGHALNELTHSLPNLAGSLWVSVPCPTDLARILCELDLGHALRSL